MDKLVEWIVYIGRRFKWGILLAFPFAALLLDSWDAFTFLNEGLDQMHTFLEGMIAPTTAISTLSSVFAAANTLFPISEAWGLLFPWVAFRSFSITLRMVKGMIPTLG